LVVTPPSQLASSTPARPAMNADSM